jgi:hypothetical protein
VDNTPDVVIIETGLSAHVANIQNEANIELGLSPYTR